MSEIEAPRAESEAETANAGFGRRLAAERIRRGLSIDDIAARLRLHPKQVQAIEDHALPALPAAFLRGFVRNYAKELRLDPAPMLAELNELLGPQAGETQRAVTGSAATSRSAPSDHGSRRVVMVGALGALIALAVVGGLATRSDTPRDTVPVAAKPAPAVAPAPAAAPVAQAPRAEPAQPPLAEAAPQTPAPTVATAPAQSPAQSPAQAPPPPPPAPESVRLSFREQSWVEITQADGRVLYARINEAGTEQSVEGRPPMRLLIGNARGVAVEYKGKAIDLKPVTNAENVAKITLR